MAFPDASHYVLGSFWPSRFMSLRATFQLLFVMASMSSAVETRADQQTVQAILDIQGLEASTRKALVAQLDHAKQKHPDLPSSTWNEVEARIHGPSLRNHLTQVWMASFTSAELKQVLQFLRTPAGRKFLQSQQVLQAKSGAAAGLWGMDVYAVLQSKHPDRFPTDQARDQKMRKLFQDALGNGGGK